MGRALTARGFQPRKKGGVVSKRRQDTGTLHPPRGSLSLRSQPLSLSPPPPLSLPTTPVGRGSPLKKGFPQLRRQNAPSALLPSPPSQLGASPASTQARRRDERVKVEVERKGKEKKRGRTDCRRLERQGPTCPGSSGQSPRSRGAARRGRRPRSGGIPCVRVAFACVRDARAGGREGCPGVGGVARRGKARRETTVRSEGQQKRGEPTEQAGSKPRRRGGGGSGRREGRGRETGDESGPFSSCSFWRFPKPPRRWFGRVIVCLRGEERWEE